MNETDLKVKVLAEVGQSYTDWKKIKRWITDYTMVYLCVKCTRVATYSYLKRMYCDECKQKILKIRKGGGK